MFAQVLSSTPCPLSRTGSASRVSPLPCAKAAALTEGPTHHLWLLWGKMAGLEQKPLSKNLVLRLLV